MTLCTLLIHASFSERNLIIWQMRVSLSADDPCWIRTFFKYVGHFQLTLPWKKNRLSLLNSSLYHTWIQYVPSKIITDLTSAKYFKYKNSLVYSKLVTERTFSKPYPAIFDRGWFLHECEERLFFKSSKEKAIVLETTYR